MNGEKNAANPNGYAFLSDVVEKKDFCQLNPNGKTRSKGEPSPDGPIGADYAYSSTRAMRNGVVRHSAKYFGGNRTGE